MIDLLKDVEIGNVIIDGEKECAFDGLKYRYKGSNFEVYFEIRGGDIILDVNTF